MSDVKVTVAHRCEDYNSYRAARVKSLFNADTGYKFEKEVVLPLEGDWKIGLVVGPSGSGKTSIGKAIWGEAEVYDPYAGWQVDRPIIDAIAPDGDFNAVTGALSAVGLGNVPAWLRPFSALSNGEQFRAGLARLIVDPPARTVLDEFTSVVDRQIAKVGSMAFAKAFRRTSGKQIVLLSCHYDIAEWVQPDWIFDTKEDRLVRDCLRRPKIDLEIIKTTGRYWEHFKPHYYLDLAPPPAAEYFVGLVDGEPVAHLAVAPLFTAKAYRATRLVVMPEWQGAGVGTKFLEFVGQYHLEGKGRCGHRYPTFFHTSHPQLCGYLRQAPKWLQTGGSLYGVNKAQSAASIKRTGKSEAFGVDKGTLGYGGHFRSIQAFKYIGDEGIH